MATTRSGQITVTTAGTAVQGTDMPGFLFSLVAHPDNTDTVWVGNASEDVAHIFTCSKPWIRHMEKVLRLNPTSVRANCREYECPKQWIRKPRRPRQLSKEQKQNLHHRLPRKKFLK